MGFCLCASELKRCRLNSHKLLACSTSVSAASHSSIGPDPSPATATGGPAARAAVNVTRRVASLDVRVGPPVLPGHSITAAGGVRVSTPTGITVTTAVSIPGPAAIIVIATAPTIPAVGWRGGPWGWGVARITCRVNGGGGGRVVSSNWQVLAVCWLVGL